MIRMDRAKTTAIVLLASLCAFALAVVACSGEDGPSSSAPDASTTSPDGGVDPRGDSSTSPDGRPLGDGGGADAGDAEILGTPRVYVGSGDGKIRMFAFDTDAGSMSPAGTFDAGNSASFLAFDSTRRFVYSTDESGASAIRAFAVDGQTGALTALNQAASGGGGPTHVSVDRAGGYVLVANYGGGTINVIRRQADGSLGASAASRSFGGGAQTHQIVADPTNAFLLVPNKGLDAVAVLPFTAATGAIADGGFAAAGDGARHIDFHPSGGFAYVINENASTMTGYTYANGALTQIEELSTLPAGFNGNNTGAEVQVAPSGAFVYGSNRGHDSIVIFSINQTTGRLTLVGHQPTQGQTPRHFSIDRTGRFLFVGNQGSNNVVVMRVNGSTGTLTPVGSPVGVPSPAWVGLIYL
jgi:6-phosphogluconolactonase